jgi:hypothetical protein
MLRGQNIIYFTKYLYFATKKANTGYSNVITVVVGTCIWDFFQSSCLLSEKTAPIVISVGVLIQNTLVGRGRRGRDLSSETSVL